MPQDAFSIETGLRQRIRNLTPSTVRNAVIRLRDRCENIRRHWPKPHVGLTHLGLARHQIYPEGTNFHKAIKEAAARALIGLEIDRDTCLASIGSCFAEEFSTFIRARGLNYLSLEPSSFGFSADWGRVYTVPNLRQIIDYSFSEDFPVIIEEAAGRHFDPLREHNPDAANADEAARMIHQHRRNSRAAFETAEVLVITLGQCEAWRDLEKGVVWGRKPPSQILTCTQGRFENETFGIDDNITELSAALNTLLTRRPHLKVIITVSPVPAYATFFDDDVITRSFANKCALRLVADEAVRTFPERVHYFPSFEMALAYNPATLRADNRHVKYTVVSRIMSTFLDRNTP